MEHPFQQEVKPKRKTEYPIHPIILDRWSPRSMTGEEMSDDELFPLFEAAKWAPSSYNNQPWRFLYAKRNTPHWPLFFNLLVEANQTWTKNAAVLVCIVSNTLFERNGKPCRTHTFDTGAAWMALALEGGARGYVIHGMEGFDYKKAAQTLKVPDTFQVEAMVAIGKRAPAKELPPNLQQNETPSPRKKIKEIAIEGTF
jgi:nitroreductase